LKGGEAGGGRQGGKMTQIMYAHVNKKIEKKRMHGFSKIIP
jgi:hypothetical protein